MESKLLLYFDSNKIIPVSCDAGGQTHETEALSVEKGFDDSHIECVRDFYQKTAGIDKIQTHYVFSEKLSLGERQLLMQAFGKAGMRPISYSSIPAVVLTQYALKEAAVKNWEFSDSVVVVYSDEDSLRICGTIFDGEKWQWKDDAAVVANVGSSPHKRCLVECLVDNRDSNLHYLDAAKREKQIAYQMRFADAWMAKYASLGDNDDFVVPFRFDFEQDCTNLRIRKAEIESHYEKFLAPAVSSLREYKEKQCGNSVRYAVLVGSAFEEEGFSLKIRNALDCEAKSSVFSSNRLSKAFAEYLKSCDLEESPSLFEQTMQEQQNSVKAAQEWMRHAQSLKDFNDQLYAGLNELERRVGEDERSLKLLLQDVDKQLKSSNFSKAKECLGTKVFPSSQVEVSKELARKLIAKKENYEGIFGKMPKKGDAALQLVSSIRSNCDRIKALIACSDSHIESIVEKGEKIQFFEEHYGDYLELKRELNRDHTVRESEEIVRKMSELTMETLPEVRLAQVKAHFTCKREQVKGGFLKKKQEVITIVFSVENNETLPCDAIINVANCPLVERDESKLSFEMEKGTAEHTVRIDKQTCAELDFGKTIYCYVFVADGVRDATAIKCACAVIKAVA